MITTKAPPFFVSTFSAPATTSSASAAQLTGGEG
jgi:hypothetical protein